MRRKKSLIYLGSFSIIFYVILNSSSQKIESPTCEKVKKIAYLKTHKCASTTVQNILLRFAVQNDLNVVLPATGNYLGRHYKYQRAMISNTPWEMAGLDYHIFCLHTVWNQEEVRKTVGEDAVYVTMLRDPVQLFESLWNYGKLHTFYHTDLETFALAPKVGKLAMRAFGNLGKNMMLHDLGLSEKEMSDPEVVKQKIQEIDQHFNLVLIAERFQESMVLMKNELCWDVSDVVNLKLNARQEKKKTSLSDKARKALEEYLWADYELYDYFNKKFEQKLDNFGHLRLKQELSLLEKENNKTKELCGLQMTKNENLVGEKKLWGNGVVGYQTETDLPICRYMSMAENAFLDYLREIQGERAMEAGAFFPANFKAPDEIIKQQQQLLPQHFQQQLDKLPAIDMNKIQLMLKGVKTNHL